MIVRAGPQGLFLYPKTEKVEEKTYDTLSDFILVWDC
nr:MAG TPA: hypothetical protein [Caudoviricetes sp.]